MLTITKTLNFFHECELRSILQPFVLN